MSTGGPTIAGGTTTPVNIDFFENADGTSPYGNVEAGDFFVVTLTFKNGQSATYFVAPA